MVTYYLNGHSQQTYTGLFFNYEGNKIFVVNFLYKTLSTKFSKLYFCECPRNVTYCHLLMYPAPLDTEIIFGRPLQCFYSLLSLQREISRSVCREKLNQKVRTIPLSSRNNYLPMTQFRTWSEVNDPLIDLSAVFFQKIASPFVRNILYFLRQEKKSHISLKTKKKNLIYSF